MIKDLIINEVERDLSGLGYLITKVQQTPETKLPEHFYIVQNNSEHRLKHNLLYGAVFATAVASASPEFKQIDFSNQHNGSAIELYHKHVEAPLNSSLLEYKLHFEHSFSLEKFLNEVLSFKSLENNWDGYGAIPTEVKSATQAISLASRLSERTLSKVSDVFPNPNGTVTIEWENHSGEKLVAEIGNNTFSYYLELNALPPKFFNNVQVGEESVSALNTHIKKLFI
jgi:hypothetical protein